MIAIWPAGPPKVCNEIANQTRVASRRGMTSPAAGRIARVDAASSGVGGCSSGVVTRVPVRAGVPV